MATKRPTVDAPSAARTQRHLHLVRGQPRTSPERPATVLHAAVQRWRSQFVWPLWRVQVVWVSGLRAACGLSCRRSTPDRRRTVLLEVDGDLPDSSAQREVMRSLAEVQLEELRLQCQGASGGPPAGAGDGPGRGRRGQRERAGPDGG